MSARANYRETYYFTVLGSEMTPSKKITLKEDSFDLRYCLRHDTRKCSYYKQGVYNGLPSCTTFSATLIPAEKDKCTGKKGSAKIGRCEMQIRDLVLENVLSQSRENLNGSNQFEFDMKIHGCYRTTVIRIEVSFIFDRKSENVSILSSMKKMQSEGTLTDFVIKTKEAEIPCHKVVLAASSDYFKNMLTVQMREREENVLNWEGVFDQTTVEDLLHFVYTEDTPPNIAKTCFSLVEVAHMCLIEVLKDICVAEIVSQVKLDNVVEVLVMGEKFESETLKKTALNFIVENFDFANGDVRQLPGWNQVEPELAKNLLASIIKHRGKKEDKSVKISLFKIL